MTSFKKIAIATGIVLAALQAPAMAQVATQNINLNATVADYCTIGGISNPADLTRTITAPNGIVSTVVALTPITITNVVCSKISNVALSTTRTGLRLTPHVAAPSGFESIIHYTATASFTGAAPSLVTSSATSATAATTGAANASLTVTITPTANVSPMVAGAYTDTLVVTLTPQP